MYKIEYSTHMRRDMKRMKKRGKDLSKLTDVLGSLLEIPFRHGIVTICLPKTLRECGSVILSLTGC